MDLWTETRDLVQFNTRRTALALVRSWLPFLAWGIRCHLQLTLIIQSTNPVEATHTLTFCTNACCALGGGMLLLPETNKQPGSNVGSALQTDHWPWPSEKRVGVVQQQPLGRAGLLALPCAFICFSNAIHISLKNQKRYDTPIPVSTLTFRDDASECSLSLIHIYMACEW